MTGCPICGEETKCKAQENFATFKAAAADNFSVCHSDEDWAAMYVISCNLDGSPHLTPEQDSEQTTLHYQFKADRENAQSV